MSWEPNTEEIRLRKQKEDIERLNRTFYVDNMRSNESQSPSVIGSGVGQPSFNFGSVGDVIQAISTVASVVEDGATIIANTIPLFGAYQLISHLLGGEIYRIQRGVNGQKVTIRASISPITIKATDPTTNPSTTGNVIMDADLILGIFQSVTYRFQTDITYTDDKGGWIIDSASGTSSGGGSSTVVNSIKNQVRVATEFNYALFPLVGDVIDGVTVVANDRILVKAQTTQADNGIYKVDSVVATVATLSRVSDFNSSSNVVASALVAVQEGTLNADTVWILTTNNPITVGTTALTFVNIATSVGDDLGNHIATNDLNMSTFDILQPDRLFWQTNVVIQGIDSTPTDGIIDRLEYNAGNLGAHDFYVDRPNTIIPRFGITETQVESNVPINVFESGGDVMSLNMTAGGAFLETDNPLMKFFVAGATRVEIDVNTSTAITQTAYGINPTYSLFNDDATPNDGDFLGSIFWHGRTSTAVKRLYSTIFTDIVSKTNGAENARMHFSPITNGLINSSEFRIDGDSLEWEVSQEMADGAQFIFYRNDSSPTDLDIISNLTFDGKDSIGTRTTYAEIRVSSYDVTDGTEDGQIAFKVRQGGPLSTAMTIGGSGSGGVEVSSDFYTTGSTASFASASILLGDSSSDLISFVGTSFTDLDMDTHSVIFQEIATPSNPPANEGKLYSKDAGGITSLFWLDSAGTETNLVSVAGGSGANQQLSNLTVTSINTNLIPSADGIRNIGSVSFYWDEIFARTMIFKGDKPVDATESAIGANSSYIWINQTNASQSMSFRWDDVESYNFARTIFYSENPVLTWQLRNGLTNVFSVTDTGSYTEINNTKYSAFYLQGGNASGTQHTRLVMPNVGTSIVNTDEILFDSSGATVDDISGQIRFVAHTSTGANFDAGRIQIRNEVPTNGTRSGSMLFSVSNSGTENTSFILLDGFFGEVDIYKKLVVSADATFNSTTFSVNSSTINIGNGITDAINFTGRSNTSFLPIGNSAQSLGGASNHWDEVYTSDIVLRGSGGIVGTTTPRISADAGGITFNVVDVADAYEFYVNGIQGLTLAMNVTTSNKLHGIAVDNTSLSLFTNANADELTLSHGTSRSANTFTLLTDAMELRTTDSTTNAFALDLIQDNVTPATGRLIAGIRGIAENTASTNTTYGEIDFVCGNNVTSGSENGNVNIYVQSASNLVKIIGMEGSSTGTRLGFFNTTPSIRPSGYSVLNYITDRVYDANATSTAELADVLGTLIADLKLLGLIA